MADKKKGGKPQAPQEENKGPEPDQNKNQASSKGPASTQGNVILTIQSANLTIDLDSNQSGNNKQDPYVKVNLNGNLLFTSGVARNAGKTPVWNKDNVCSFQRQPQDKEVIIELWDQDTQGVDDLIGIAKLDLEKNCQEKPPTLDLPVISGEDKKSNIGTVKIGFQVSTSASSAANKPPPQQQQQLQMQSLTVVVKSADLLIDVDQEEAEGFGTQDPLIKLILSGNEVGKTATARNAGKKPVWNDNNSFTFNRSAKDTELLVQVWDQDTNRPDEFIAQGKIDLDKLLKERPAEKDFNVTDKDQKQQLGTVKLSFQYPEKQSNSGNGTQGSSQLQGLNIKKVDLGLSVSSEELQRKTKEIEERLNSIQVKLKTDSITEYIEEKLHKALVEGLKKVGQERPPNPIKELGHFLINYEENDAHKGQK